MSRGHLKHHRIGRTPIREIEEINSVPGGSIPKIFDADELWIADYFAYPGVFVGGGCWELRGDLMELLVSFFHQST